MVKKIMSMTEFIPSTAGITVQTVFRLAFNTTVLFR